MELIFLLAAGVAAVVLYRLSRSATKLAATDDATPGADLSKLEALTVAQAQSLSLSESGELLLRNLRELTPEVAYALAQYRGALYLEGVVSLSEEAARALATHEGHLCLTGLKSISVPIAEELAKHSGHLDLRGLKMLPADAAAVLATTQSDLDLSGLISLSTEAAMALARHVGELRLDGLQSLSDEAADALAEHQNCLLPNTIAPPPAAETRCEAPAAESYSLDDRVTIGKPLWIEQARFRCERKTLMSIEDIGEEFNPGIELPPGEWVVETAHLYLDLQWGSRIHELRVRSASESQCSEFGWPEMPQGQGDDWCEPAADDLACEERLRLLEGGFGLSADAEVRPLNWVWVDGGSVVVSLAPASEEEEEGDWGRPELCNVRPSGSGFPRIVCMAGFGDGNYPVGGRYRNGQLVEVRIRFILIVPPENIAPPESVAPPENRYRNKPSYEIDRPELPAIFFEALNVAGARLQEEFNKHKGRRPASRDYKWIKTEFTYPAFADLTFAYGNQLFSVLVDLCADGESFLADMRRDMLLDAASQHILVPCQFRVLLPSVAPAEAGWNLTHLATGQQIVPKEIASDAKIPMSEWELRNFAIQVVRNHIENDLHGKIQSFCDMLKIEPQIWFEDANGNTCWVIVRHMKNPHEEAISHWVGLENSNPKFRTYDGFFAGVSFASDEPLTGDTEGQSRSASEQLLEHGSLYRGETFNIRFEGLKRIHVY